MRHPSLGVHFSVAPANAGNIREGLTLADLSAPSEPVVISLQSKDPELGGEAEAFFSRDEEGFLPEPLKKVPERRAIWDFILKPTSSLLQIFKRQALLTRLSEAKILEQIYEAKNASYQISQGIELLFALKPVDRHGDHYEPALLLYRQDHSELEEYIYDALGKIEQGKKALDALINLLLQEHGNIMQEIIFSLDEHMRKVDHFGEEYFIHGDYDQFGTEELTRELHSDIIKIGMFISFAILIKREGLTEASFDPSRPLGYKDAWLFARDKNKQVFNDASANSPLTVLCGSNMSGKSFNLKQTIYLQLLAQSFGYVPCREGNFDLYDSIFYLDRTASSSVNDLSAFGQEINEWNEAFEKAGDHPIFFVDEGFSTTSPEDQYRLLRAVSIYLKKRGSRMLLASHNEKFVAVSQDDPEVGVYHFETVVAENGDMAYSYKLKPGADDSKALAVAANLGLPQEVIEVAQAFLAGEYQGITSTMQPLWRQAERFTDEELAAMKQGDRVLTWPGKEDKFLQLLSEDRAFMGSYFSGSRLQTGEKPSEGELDYGGWRYRGAVIRSSWLMALTAHSNKLTPQETLERQRMFAELASNDQYEQIRTMANQIVWIEKFLGHIFGLHGYRGLLSFNNSLLDYADIYYERMLEHPDVVLAHLRLNKKVLGDAFPLEVELQQVEAVVHLQAKIADYYRWLDVDEIQRIIEQQSAQPIASTEAFLELATDEPEPEKWGGVVSRRRVKEYLAWLDDENFSKLFEHRNLCHKLSAEVSGCGDVSFNAVGLRQRYLELATDEPGKEEWGDCLCGQRVEEYLVYLQKIEKPIDDIREKISDVAGLLSRMSRAHADLNIEDRAIRADYCSLVSPAEGTREAQVVSKGKVLGFMCKIIEKISKTAMVGRPLYCCRLDDIAEELKTIIGFFKPKYKGHDCQFDHNWPEKLSLLLVLEIALDPRRYVEELVATLRGYQSPYLHQYANCLEGSIGEVWGIADLKDPKDIFTYFQKIFDAGFKEMFDQLYEIEQAAQNGASEEEIKSRVAEVAREHNLKLKEYADEYGDRRQVKIENPYQLRRAMAGAFEKQTGSRSFGRHCEHIIPQVEWISALALFGHMIKEQGFSPVEFNSTGAFKFDGMWSMIKPKASQVANPAEFPGKESLKLIAGPNMSGKTFYLTAFTFAVATALATGYAPASFATMPFFEGAIYLDRVTSREDPELSAFGQEIQFWKQYLDAINGRQAVFACVDEAFSTTSPANQSALTYAIAHATITNGGRLVLASHNHDAIAALQAANPGFVTTYHFSHHFDAEGKIDFDYQLAPGHKKSQAVAVAQKLGFPQEIIEIAASI